MRLRCLASGGRELAADTIERAFLTGEDHLVDEELIGKVNNRSLLASKVILPAMVLGILGLLGYLVHERVM